MTRSLYRLIASDPSTPDDFKSKETPGQPLRDDNAETRRLWRRISDYATEAQAHRKVRISPALGRDIARIDLAEADPIVCARTTASSGHHTLWGEPSPILARVTAIVAIFRQRSER